MAQTVFTFKSAGFPNIIKEYQELGSAQKQLDALVRSLAKAFEAQGQSSKVAVESARELAKQQNLSAESIAKLNVRNKELQQGNEAIAAVIKRRISDEQGLVKSQQAQEAAVTKLSFTLKGNVDSFNKLGAAFKGNFVEAQNAANAYEKLRSSGASLAQTQTQLASQLGVSKEQFKALNTELTKTKGSVTQAQQQLAGLGLAVSAGVTVAFTAGVKQFAEFEQTIRQIGVITNSSGTPALKNLTDVIKQLGLETTKTPQEIVEVAKSLGKAGFSADETAQALSGIVKGSEATGEALSTVGDVVTKTIRQFGLAASDSTRVADVLTKVANTSNVDISGLGESLKFVGIVAKQSNQSVEDTTAVLGLLGDAGLQGGQGGRNLAQALTRLNIASAELPPELEGVVRGSARMRGAFDLLQTSVRDSNNQLKPLPEVVKGVKSSLEGFNAGEKAVLLKAIFGDEGGRAFSAAIGRSVEDIDKAVAAANNATGTVDEGSKTLTQGLAGGFALLDSSLGLLAQNMGESVAPALDLLVRNASNLINSFVSLPAPVQNLVFGFTGLVGILGAATAAIALYNLAVAAGVIASAKLAVGLVTGSAAFIVNTGAVVANTIALVAKALAAQGIAGVLPALSTGLGITTVSVTAFTTALASVLVPLFAITAAIAAVQFIKFIGESNDASDALDELAKQSIASSNEFANIGAKIKSYNEQLKSGTKLTEEQTKQAKAFLAISKAKVAALEEEAKASKAQAEDFGKKGLEDQKNAALANAAGIDTQIKALNNQNTALEKNLTFQVQKAGAEKRSTDESIKGSAASKTKTDALKDETAELKKQIEVQKEKAKQRFDDSETKVKRDQDDQKETRKERDDGAVEKIQEASTARQTKIKEASEVFIAGIQEKNSEVLNAKKVAFESGTLAKIKEQSEAKIQGLQSAFNQSQDNQKAAFNETQRTITAQFNKTQNDEKKAFELALSKEKKDFDKQAAAEGKGVDRQLQLEDPANKGKEAELQKQFENEDKLAARRAELEAPLLAKKQEFEDAQAVKKQEFEDAQAAKKQEQEAALQAAATAFEAQLATDKAKFEKEIIAPAKLAADKQVNDAKAAFEKNVIAPLKKQQDEEVNAKKKAVEAEITAIKKADEATIGNLKKQQAQQERDIDRKQQDEKLARERAFKAEERTKEDAANKALEAIKGKSDTAQKEAAEKQLQASQNQLNAANAKGKTPPGRKDGGSVAAGQAYLVGEVEPEIFVPGVSGTILNQSQIKANLDKLLMVSGRSLQQPIAQSNDKSIIEELILLRKIVESREPKIEIPTVFEGEKSKDHHAEFVKLQRSLIRGLI